MRIVPNSGLKPVNPERALIAGEETIAGFASKILEQSGKFIQSSLKMMREVTRHPPKKIKQTTHKADHIKPPTGK